MTTILDHIIASKKEEVLLAKKRIQYTELQELPAFKLPCRSISEALITKSFGIIAEIKRKSPSAGTINENLNVVELAKTYEQSGAAAISCLTDFPFFGGTLEDLLVVRDAVDIPVLRKEFIIDDYQVFEAKAHGADAILLIAEVLNKEEISHLTIVAQSLGMEVILELHHSSEIDKINELVNVIGVNNRDLRAQQTDLATSFNLYPYLPKERVLISESGIKTATEMMRLKEVGFHGVLIGESILKSKDAHSFIKELTLTAC